MMDTLMIILIVLSAILWIWVVYDINKTRIRNKISLLWLLLMLVFPMIGPIIYFQMKRRLLTKWRLLPGGYFGTNYASDFGSNWPRWLYTIYSSRYVVKEPKHLN